MKRFALGLGILISWLASFQWARSYAIDSPFSSQATGETHLGLKAVRFPLALKPFPSAPLPLGEGSGGKRIKVPLVKGDLGGSFLQFELYALSQRPVFTCPADVETLTNLMLQDLPNYANRVIQRARRLDREVDIYSYVIVAGQPEFEPLSLDRYLPIAPSTEVEPPQQVFFTTLERQYQEDKVFSVENYHWLFLVKTKSGWRMSMIYTRFGSSGNRSPLPPRETSQSVIGRAVSLWLRDCRAGTIRN